MRRIVFGLAALASLASAAGASAREADGAYAIKGVGRSSCADFVRAYAGAADSEGRTLLPYAGWIDGYVTGFNHFQPETYDLTPWQTTELMLAMIGQHCREDQNRERLFIEAANALALVLYPDRLEAESEIVRVESIGQAVFMYRDLLEDVRERLVAAGFAPGPEGATYDRDFANALRAYQAKRGLPTSGLPDQPTLNALFMSDARPAP